MSKLSVAVAVSCLGGLGVLWSHASPVAGKRTTAASYPLAVRPDSLTRGGAVLIAPQDIATCTRRGAALPGPGGVVLGLAACDAEPDTRGWMQLERVFDAPFQTTVLTVRTSAPPGARAIQSVSRDGRARILFDGRSVWDARASIDDGMAHYVAIAEPDIMMTIVIHGRGQHSLRWETEPGVTWNIGTITISADPAPRSIKGIAYSPYRDCMTPGGARQPTRSDIDDDMHRIVHASTAIRTYSALGMNAQAVASAEAAGQPVYAGAWLDKVAGDDAELRGLIDLARSGRLQGYIVGNEFYLRHHQKGRAAVDYLLERIRMFKTALPQRHAPVMTAEVDGMMFEWACDGGRMKVMRVRPDYEPILDATDAVLVHIYPFWDGRPLDGAAAFTAARYIAIRDFVQQRYPGKSVIIGETGWPSAGRPFRNAVPGREAQRQYMAELMLLADAKAIDYFYFDAFDEGWKIEEDGHVGQHWGYADATRAAKHDISGMLIPAPFLAAIAGTPAAPPLTCDGGPRPTSGVAASVDPSRLGSSSNRVVYSDWLSEDSRYVPSGWMGDTDKIDVFECDRSAPHGGDMAIRAQFSPDGKRGWAGVVWREPESSEGQRPDRRDLRGADQLSFWVKGGAGGEVVEFKVGGVGEEHGPLADTLRPARSSGPLVLSRDWHPVSIALRGGDLKRVNGAFSWVASRCQNAQPITFFMDDIRFEAAAPTARAAALPRAPFHVYDDEGSGCGHFVPSGFMGDTRGVRLNTRSTGAPFKGRTAIHVTYRPSDSSDHPWAGVYWQAPNSDWGRRDAGFDLSWATILTFHARGRNGGEVVEFIAGGMGKARDRYRDSLPIRTTGPVRLKQGWHRYAIDLRGGDLTRVVGGFAFSVSAMDNPAGAEFFLDEIAYERR